MRYRVLVVDDDDLVLSGLTESLQREGFEVDAARSGADALSRVAAAPPVDAVLTDLVMDGLDGLGLLRRLRAEHPAIPAVVLTGHGTPSNAVEAIREGAADYILKPARPEDIAQRLRTVLETHALRRRLLDERETVQEQRLLAQQRVASADRMMSIRTMAEGLAEDLAAAASVLNVEPGRALKALPDDHALRPAVEKIREAAMRIDALLRALRSLAEEDRVALEPTDLNAVLAGFLRSREFEDLRLQRPNVTVEATPAAGLPSLAGDPARLQQAIALVLGAALDAAPPGGRVLVSTARESRESWSGPSAQAEAGDCVVLRVHHAGCFAAEHVDRFFEPYYARRRMDRRRTPPFALARLYGIVRAHGACVNVQSGPALGTDLILRFPVAAAPAESPAGSAAGPVAGAHVLVVDDHAGHRAEATAMLERLGYRVSAVASGYEALELLARGDDAAQPVELLVLDLFLGDDLDGVDAYRRIAAIRPGLRAILAGGFVETGRVDEARAMGIAAYVQKPYTPGKLAGALRAAFGGD